MSTLPPESIDNIETTHSNTKGLNNSSPLLKPTNSHTPSISSGEVSPVTAPSSPNIDDNHSGHVTPDITCVTAPSTADKQAENQTPLLPTTATSNDEDDEG